jgi:predicted transcriptional regulator YdeE
MKKLFLYLGCIISMNGIKAEPAFDVIGIVTYTSNKAAFQEGTIAKLWQRFFAEEIFNKIPNKCDNAVIALYHDYESDKNGGYSLLIGVRVNSTENVPAGMVAKHVIAEDRMLFTTKQGPLAQVVVGEWQNIWDMENQGELRRSYTCDYELYDERSYDPAHAVVEIHIGVKK